MTVSPFNSFLGFLSIFLNPPFVAASPLFISIFLSLISLAGLFLQLACPARFLGDIYLPFPWFSPVLILKQDFWGVSVLFRLSYMYLMRKRSSREPLINTEVTISVILIPSGNFLRYV